MTEEDGELPVAQRLGRLLDRGLLPAGGPAEAAERLIERLERPARVALLGLPGSGKSSVLNLLAGTVVVPETLRLPTIIVQHGPEARMHCTLADGRVEEVAGNDLEKVLTLNPALVTVEMDLPSLKVISLLEVSAGPMETEQRRAAVWASKRADILIWCTTSYLPKEQVVWESMPDSVKDNGFLFLTKTDLLGSPEAARGMLERVEQRAGEEFRQVLSISAKQARTAMPPGGPIDREMFRDSGAAAVITTIKTRVQMARRADTDMAELLLARHVEAGGIVARLFAETDPELHAATDTAQEWTPPKDAAEPQVTTVASLSWPEATPEPEAFPEDIEPEFASDQWEDLEEKQEADADAVARIVSAIEQGPEPERPPVMILHADPPAEAEPEAEPAAESDLEEEAEATTLMLTDPELPAASGGKRFSDRIRQAAPASVAAAAPPVPLRTTWKSRNEAAAPAAAEPKQQLTPRKDIPKAPPSPRGKVARASAATAEPAETGPDEAAIAAMLAAAAAPQGKERTPRDRSSRATPTAPETTPGGSAPSGHTVRTRLFGARKATAETDAQDQEPADAPQVAPEAAAEAAQIQPPQDVLPAAEEGAPGKPPAATPRPPDVPSAQPPRPAVQVDLASPRVAVLRQRRPDPSGSERRERPRIAARVVAATPAPAAGPRSVPASEHGILDQAVALIISRASDLERLIEPTEKPPVDLILDHGRETTEQVIEVLSQATSAELRRINGDLSEVQDLIMLMQLERGHAPADDAMTLILQIRRDLETLRAA